MHVFIEDEPPRTTFTQTDKEQRREQNSSSVHTGEEPPFDDELFNEATRVACESLESEGNIEVVCSTIGQTPYENIKRATQSDSVWGDSTPSEVLDVVTRKSEDVLNRSNRAKSALLACDFQKKFRRTGVLTLRSSGLRLMLKQLSPKCVAG